MPKNEEWVPASAFTRQTRTERVTETEAGGDYTLPDYLPQIRRVLRTDAVLIPAGTYVGKDRAECSGIAAFSLLYTDEEGLPAAVPLDADYGFAAEDAAGVSAVTREDGVVSVTCRPQGPRRAVIRTRVCGKMTLYAETAGKTPEELLPDGVLPEETETLVREAPAMLVLTGESGELSASGTATAEGLLPEDLRILWCRAEAVVTSAAACAGGARLSGEVRAVCLAEAGRGTLPLCFRASIPVEETVPVPGAEEGAFAVGHGVVRSLDVHATANGQGGASLLFDAEYGLFAAVCRNRPYRWVQDLYGFRRQLACRYREEKISAVTGCRQEVIPLTVSAKREGDAAEATAVVDATGRLLSCDVAVSKGKLSVSGEWEAQLILSGAPDCKEGNVSLFPYQVRLPYRAEIPLQDGAGGDDADVRASLSDVRARIEDGEFLFSADLCTSAILSRQKTVTAVDGVTEEGEAPQPENGVVTLYYPEEKESLWSIAKKYRVPLASLLAKNDLPQDALSGVDLPKKLDGVSALLIG